jgi:hypothetical protein
MRQTLLFRAGKNLPNAGCETATEEKLEAVP